MAASLTGGLDGGERRRGGGATATSSGGRRGSPAALHGRGRGRIRRGIEGGEGGEASPARNRATAHQNGRIAAAGGGGTALLGSSSCTRGRRGEERGGGDKAEGEAADKDTRGARIAGAGREDGRRRRRVRRAEQNRGGEGEADGWARRGKIYLFLFFPWAVTEGVVVDRILRTDSLHLGFEVGEVVGLGDPEEPIRVLLLQNAVGWVCSADRQYICEAVGSPGKTDQ